MRPQIEEEIEKLLQASPSQEALPDIVPTNPRDIEFVAGIRYTLPPVTSRPGLHCHLIACVRATRASIDAWLQGDASSAEPLVLVVPNSFLRRLVYQEVRSRCALARQPATKRACACLFSHALRLRRRRSLSCAQRQVSGAQRGEGPGHVGQHVHQPHERGGEGRSQSRARSAEARCASPPSARTRRAPTGLLGRGS
jgi:hypothetical protein